MQECRMPFHRPPAPASGAAPGTDDSAMGTLYSAALGPVQLPRYLALFERFDRAGRAPAGWNLAAALATLNWMLLHHLWSAALVYVALVEGLALLVFGVGRPLLRWPEQVEWGLFAAFALFAIVLPGLFGDALLHREIRKRIAHALVAAHTMPEAHILLARQASSWQRLAWIAVGNVLLFAALAVAWTLVPPGGWGGSGPSEAQLATGAVQAGAGAVPTVPQGATQRPPAPDPRASDAASAAPPASRAAEALSPAAAVRETAQPTRPAPPLLAHNNALARAGAGAAQAPASSPASPAAPRAQPASAPVATPAKAPAASEPAAATPQARPASPPTATKTPPTKAPVRAAPPPAPTKRNPEPVEAAPRASTPAASAPRPAAPAAAASAPLGSAPGYYLNVGLFAEEANARRAQAKLLNANLPAFRQSFSTSSGQRTRVRVGPFATAAEAQKAAQQIRRMQLEAVMYQQRG